MNANDPVFPSPAFDAVALPGCEAGPVRGIGFREYAAMHLLKGLISNPDITSKVFSEDFDVVKIATVFTDALILELNKKPKP